MVSPVLSLPRAVNPDICRTKVVFIDVRSSVSLKPLYLPETIAWLPKGKGKQKAEFFHFFFFTEEADFLKIEVFFNFSVEEKQLNTFSLNRNFFFFFVSVPF